MLKCAPLARLNANHECAYDRERGEDDLGCRVHTGRRAFSTSASKPAFRVHEPRQLGGSGASTSGRLTPLVLEERWKLCCLSQGPSFSPRRVFPTGPAERAFNLAEVVDVHNWARAAAFPSAAMTHFRPLETLTSVPRFCHSFISETAHHSWPRWTDERPALVVSCR